MTVRITATLWCDHPACNDADAYNQARDYDTAKAVRTMAAEHDGWTRRNGRDYCGDHSE